MSTKVSKEPPEIVALRAMLNANMTPEEIASAMLIAQPELCDALEAAYHVDDGSLQIQLLERELKAQWQPSRIQPAPACEWKCRNCKDAKLCADLRAQNISRMRSYAMLVRVLILCDNLQGSTDFLHDLEASYFHANIEWPLAITPTPQTPHLAITLLSPDQSICPYHLCYCWDLDNTTDYEHSIVLQHLTDEYSRIVCVGTNYSDRYQWDKVFDRRAHLPIKPMASAPAAPPAHDPLPATPVPNPKTKTTKERMTPDQLATQFAIFADEVKPEHQALCTQALVKGEEAALKFLKMVDRNAKWIVARDHCTWRRRLSRMPCTGTDRGPKSWTQTTLVQWYYIEGRDIVTKT